MAIALGQVSNEMKDCTCHWWPYRIGHGTDWPLERLSRLQHDAHGDQLVPRPCSPNTAEVRTSSIPITHLPQIAARLEASSSKGFSGTEVRDFFCRRSARAIYRPNMIQAQAAGPDVIHLMPPARIWFNALQAGGAVRSRQALPYRRRATGAGGPKVCHQRRGPPASGPGYRMLLALKPTCRTVRIRRPLSGKSMAGRCRRSAPWFGTSTAWTARCRNEKNPRHVKLAKATRNFKLPPEIALMPYDTFYRAAITR